MKNYSRIFLVIVLAISFNASFSACSKKEEARNSTTQNTPESAENLASVPVRLDSTTYLYEGTVGDKLRVNAQFAITNGRLDGTYRYHTGSCALSLRGSVQADNTVQITERDDLSRGGWEKDSNETVSGRLFGKLDPEKGIITGTWTSKDGKKSFPFSLRAVAPFIMLKHSKLDASVHYPAFAAPELAALKDTLAQLSEKKYQSSVASIDTMRKEYAQEESMKDRMDMLSEHSQVTVVYIAPNIVSLLWMYDSYGGGAHGNYGYEGMTWKLESGAVKRCKLTDIFRADTDFRAKISDILVADLKKQQASLVVEGGISSFVDDLVKENLTFTVHPSGITFHFAPYAVASYAESSFETHITWKSLQDYLRSDFPLPLVKKM
ncbi:MAG: DUF3298 domain-containing protein [Candidatus Kapaibacterium sp.]|nr:MAG: DUF3298 domain-containing protein [Candidatus Kapabacteria bacterium]